MWFIGTPPGGGCVRGAAPGGPVAASGTEVDGVKETESKAAETSEITDAEEAGSAWTPPNPGIPN